MRNKNTVIFLLIIFTIICGYNLYWTYVQFDAEGKINTARSAFEKLEKVKSDKAEWTAEDSAVMLEYDEIIKDTEFQAKRKKAIERSFTLGLDLQGGMFVTLEIGVEELLKTMSTNATDSSLLKALSCATERQKSEPTQYVDLFVDCYEQQNPNGSLGVLFSSEELGISVGSNNSEVKEILQSKANSAIDRTFNILRTRIDQFGVASPNLQKQESTGRILMELPGVKDPERVRQLIVTTAELEFYVCRSFADAVPVLQEINDKMRVINGIVAESDSNAVDSTLADGSVDENAELLADNEGAEADTSSTDSSSSDSISSISDLIDEEGDVTDGDDQASAEDLAKYRRENPLFGLFASFSQYNPNYPNSPRIGYVHYNDTAKVNAILALEEIKSLIPPDMHFAWSFKGEKDYPELFMLYAIRASEDGEPDMSGDAVATARQDYGQTGDEVVTMRMTAEGTKRWAALTQANVNNSIAVLLDGKVYSAPNINEAITGGNTEISGDFSLEEAKDLANVLEAGQLPVPARIQGEETIGPTLGAENISDGFSSFIAAFIITLIFMGLYYARAGLVANVALLANLVFFLGCSAAFTIVLTMPGVAAVVLTVGMAVDANVLIFERIREELAKDKTMKASIKAGFSNAFSSVMDANITTFLTGVVLYAFGVGPIRGFAVSLMIGIITSLISALIITRLILDWYGNRGGNNLKFGFDWTTGLFDRVKLNMVKTHKTFYYISGALVVGCLAATIFVGPKTGVDFQGGRQFKVEFLNSDESPRFLSGTDIEQIRTDLTAVFENDAPVIKTVTADNQLMITSAYKIDDPAVTGDSIYYLLTEGLKTNFSQDTIKQLSLSDVGPTVANDIQRAAIYSVIFSLLIIFMYILIRFRRWQYSLGAIIAVFHDVIITLGIFTILGQFDLGFSLEVNQAFIAALLTIIGYSINDTVVVFDRIRENIGEMKASKLDDIYDVSIDQTISRTLITSLTTFLTALILFIFGGDVIRGFVFAIMIGILVGTYSSIYVASPISLDLIKRGMKEKA
ncbi:MAG: protein translocase subunit SecDF [Bacteroidia bacterium]|nr:protein translocase subunit SecDF [Bacteroidia bacterium]